MAGYTKADYDTQYSIRAEREWGHPGDRPEVRVHYQRASIKPGVIDPRWDAIIAAVPLVATDIVVVAGSGFGWGVERLLEVYPTMNAVGVDISDYVAAAKDTDDGAEIDGYILAEGLDPLTGRGAQIKAKWHTPGPKSTQVVLQEDMKTNQSRNRVRQALGNNTPTHVFTEDMIQEFTDLEIAEWVTELDKLTTTAKIHVISGEGIRTAEEIQTLTGHRVLLVSGGIVHKDLP